MGTVYSDARYEIEIQLGATDPSHIIRTIEYWDTEKERYPQYDHCAVIVAEEITGKSKHKENYERRRFYFCRSNKYTTGYELKYNKFYIGLAKDGVAKNFISFKPKKAFLHFIFKTNENPELSSRIEDEGLDVIYESRWKQYRVKLSGFDDYKKHEELIKECVEVAMEYFNISEM